MKERIRTFHISKKTSEMIYISKVGNVTKRRVRIVHIQDTYFTAYCYLRKQVRTFEIANVLAISPVVARIRSVG